MSEKADIALIGLAVMGQNLILNMNDHGFTVCVYNRTTEKVDAFLANEAKGTKVVGAKSLEDMVAKLKKPRRVMMLVKAGQAVDDFIEKLVLLLEKGDIIIDGGNSEYHDTERRTRSLREKGLLFVGTGVSGGEDGARHGPSLMPGGDAAAWPHVKDIFQGIAAKANGEPCCDWVGDGGAGHFVKMVHNGIEYGDMQLICEAYDLMRLALKMDHQEMSDVFAEWNKGELDSFLIELTRDILKLKDKDGSYLVETTLDSAGQKGTGDGMAIAALEYGMPVSLIGEAVSARCLSSLKMERVEAAKMLSGPIEKTMLKDQKLFLEDIRQALYASKIVSYAQGFMLLREAAKVHGWNLNYGAIALIWRGGCSIQSAFLGNIKAAFDKNPSLANLLLDDFFRSAMERCQNSWRDVVVTAAQLGIPTPTFSAALAFYDGYRSARLPANLIQCLTQKKEAAKRQRRNVSADSGHATDSPLDYAASAAYHVSVTPALVESAAPAPLSPAAAAGKGKVLATASPAGRSDPYDISAKELKEISHKRIRSQCLTRSKEAAKRQRRNVSADSGNADECPLDYAASAAYQMELGCGESLSTSSEYYSAGSQLISAGSSFNVSSGSVMSSAAVSGRSSSPFAEPSPPAGSDPALGVVWSPGMIPSPFMVRPVATSTPAAAPAPSGASPAIGTSEAGATPTGARTTAGDPTSQPH